MTNAIYDYGNYTEILKYELWKAARDGHKDVVFDFLKNVIKENLMDEIINHHTEENGQKTTPLIIAAMKGNEEVVDVLLQFGAEIDKKGTVSVRGDSRSGATALWCASRWGHYNIVKLLVDNCANINLPADSGSTPLRPACNNGKFDIVRYLVEHGADVNAADSNGHTCLMFASYSGHYHIVHYLLEKGADPECVTTEGTTALHDSAEYGHFTISKLLIETGLTMTTTDNDGMTPLMMAAMNQKCSIVEYLSLLPECHLEDQIDALELLGTAFLFKAPSDLSKAYHFFERAMQERYNNPYELSLKHTIAITSIITGTTECQTVKDLEEIKNDQLAMCTKALAMLERILGLENPKVFYPMIFTGELFAYFGVLDKCIKLWLLSLRMSQCANKTFNVEYFPELFANMLYDRTKISSSYLLEVFEGVVSELTLEERRMQNDEGSTKFRENYDKDILVCLYMIGIMLLNKPTTKEKDQLHRAVYRFIHLKPRLQSGATPLHMCCDSSTNDNTIKMKRIILFPHTLICKTLLHCGADVNAQDENKQTPLHVIAKTGTSDVHIRKISMCLIEYGAHVDACTYDGESVVDVATSDTAADIVKAHMQLRLDCLAARTVMRHKLKYEGTVPSSLLQFVKLH